MGTLQGLVGKERKNSICFSEKWVSLVIHTVYIGESWITLLGGGGGAEILQLFFPLLSAERTK